MMNPPNNAPMADIPEGTSVHDVSGEKIGHISFSAMRDGFFVVEKGWLFTHQLYLPATAILAHDADGLTLRLSKEELKQDRWKQPPESAPSDIAAQAPVYPNSPMPTPSPAKEEEGTDEAHMQPFAPDAGDLRPFPPDEGNQDRVFPHNAGDLRPLPPDDARPQANEPIDPPPTQA